MPRVFRVIRSVFVSSTLMLSGLAAACAHATAPANANGVVQIAEVSANPTTLNCPTASPIYVNVRLVNTTTDSVTIVKVSSAGIIIRSSSAQLVGQSALTIASLSFTPAILRPHDGNATTTAILPAPCPHGVDAYGFVDAYVTLFVTTTTGQYSTKQVSVTFNYPLGGG